MSTSQEAPALIQYACERCKTRFVLPPSSRARSASAGRLRAFCMGLGRTVRFHEGLGASVDTARRQLLAKMDDEAYQSFVQSFRFCHECRQFVCNDCWSTSRRSLPDLRGQVDDRHRPPATPIRPRRARDPTAGGCGRARSRSPPSPRRDPRRPWPGPRSRGPGSRRPLRGLQQRTGCGGHAHALADCRRDPHADPDPDSDPDPDCDRDPDPDAGSDPDSDRDAHADTDPDSDPDAQADAEAHSDADTHACEATAQLQLQRNELRLRGPQLVELPGRDQHRLDPGWPASGFGERHAIRPGRFATHYRGDRQQTRLQVELELEHPARAVSPSGACSQPAAP